MDVVILTSVRLLGESLAACIAGREEINGVEIALDYASLDRRLQHHSVDVILVDITQGVDPTNVRALVVKWPKVRLLALGLEEQCDAVIHCGRAGFSGYVPRDAGLDVLRRAVLDCSGGRLRCPAEISGHLMRALFNGENEQHLIGPDDGLTRRQEHVISLIGRGLSNKEIARELDLSVATVKHHVHNILEKLQVTGRGHVIRRMRGPVAPTESPITARTLR